MSARYLELTATGERRVGMHSRQRRAQPRAPAFAFVARNVNIGASAAAVPARAPAPTPVPPPPPLPAATVGLDDVDVPKPAIRNHISGSPRLHRSWLPRCKSGQIDAEELSMLFFCSSRVVGRAYQLRRVPISQSVQHTHSRPPPGDGARPYDIDVRILPTTADFLHTF